MPKSARDLSVVELEKILDNQKSKLDSLSKQREQLRKKLDRVESQISTLAGQKGANGAGRRRSRKRPKNEKPLDQVVLDVLKRSKKGYPLGILTDKVLETGYKSNSSDFRNVLYQCLYKSEEIVHDTETGRYRLK